MHPSFLELRETLDEYPIFDTHEHFLDPAFFSDGQFTLLRILKNSYMAADFISAGMDPSNLQEGSIVYGPIDLARHDTISPIDIDLIVHYLEKVKNTAYSRTLLMGLKSLHEIEEDLDGRTWEKYSTIVQQNYEKADWFDTALNRMNIHHVIWDSYFTIADPIPWSQKICLNFHTDDFLDYPWQHPVEGKPAKELAQTWGIEIESFDDFLQAIDTGFTRYKERGARAIKIGVAYRRSLHFEPASKEEAKGAFLRLQSKNNKQDTLTLGNYAVRYIIQKSIENDLAVQIHTGYQCGYLDQGRPTHLVNLFQEFPKAEFVLFHGGYPFSDEAGLLAKAFPNVYLDLCWMPVLSPNMTVDTLLRWIDLVPQNKIMWGGDVWSVEECFGAVQLFKDTLATVLYSLLERGDLNTADALTLAENLMYRNAAELFGLDIPGMS